MEKQSKYAKLFDILFFCAFALFLCSAMLETTTFSNIPLLFRLISPLRKLSWLIALLKIAIQGILELKSGQYRLSWFPLLFFAGMIPCYLCCRSPHIISLSLFLLAANGIPFKKIAFHALLQQGATLIITVGCYFVGFIKGVDVGNAGEPISYSLGYNSPNCLMLIGFQLLLLYGYLRRERLKWFELPLLLAWSVLFYGASQGRIGFLCSILVIAALAIQRFKWSKTMMEKLRFIAKPFAAILCVLFLGLTYLYVRFGLNWLNELTSYRLYFAYMAIANLKLAPFGQIIQWVGQRGAELGAEGYNYNYVDSSYAKALLDYGIIPMILFLIAFYKQKSFLYQKKEYLLILLLMILEFYCFFESFLIPPIFNTTILLMKDVLYPLKEKDGGKP